LDHDVFPIRSTSIVDTMADADAYGWAQERSDVRYLWPGLLFLKREAVDPSVLDFSPWAGGDTGARLQEQVYEQLDGGQIRHMENEQRLFRPDSDEKCEVLDDWLHTVNASYWKDASPKEARILELISEYETQAQSQ
jgi:hypothetical protein